MVDLQSVTSSILPQVKIYGSLFVSTVAWVILILVFCAIAGTIAYIYIQRKQYNNTIILFEKINNEWVDTKRDKAMEMKFGDLGMTLLYARKHKKYIARPQKQSGVRKFYFRIRGDGNWENFSMRDDESEDKLKFFSTEKAITERNVGIRKGLEQRYNKQSWLKENAAMIVSVVFIVVIGIMAYLLFDKWVSLANTTNSGMETAKKVLDSTNTILSRLDNILARTGSGAVVSPPA